jgi:hypothetical protein
MYKLLLIFLVFFHKPRLEYVVVVGDLTCKACVVELHEYLSEKVKGAKIKIVVKKHQSIVGNDLIISYYKKEIPNANFVVTNKAELFSQRERYPYLLKINHTDTLKLPFDSLFSDNGLNFRHLP